jgi:DNA-binding response OmpR family regulator
MRFKILIIEDEKSLLDTLTLNLQLENFDVYPLTNSVNALDVIQNIKPDLIILDIMLQHMSGIDFYQTLLNQQIKIPTIFLTAKNNIKDKIVICECENIGISYGQFFAGISRDTNFDYYIFKVS